MNRVIHDPQTGIELFSLDRPILHVAQPPKRYMV
jgi:hypothetical protein